MAARLAATGLAGAMYSGQSQGKSKVGFMLGDGFTEMKKQHNLTARLQVCCNSKYGLLERDAP